MNGDEDPELILDVDDAEPDYQDAEKNRKEALDKLQEKTTKWLNDRKK